MDLEKEALLRGRKLRILVTRLRYLGDVIITTPVLSALKRRYPTAEIHYLTEARYAPVLYENPFIDRVIELKSGIFSSLSVIHTMRQTGFVAALDLFFNPRSAFLLYLSGIPIRIGGSRKWRRRFYTDIFSVPPAVRSTVAYSLNALDCFDIEAEEELPRIYLTDEERSEGVYLLEETIARSPGGRLVVAVHPGGTWQSKRWKPESFATLADNLVKRHDARVVIITGPGEEGIAEAVRNESNGRAFVLPHLPLRSLAAVLNSCDAVIANDGGVLHMAVALGRPTVGIFGPTEPDIWFPYEGKGPFVLVTRNEDCAPCHKHYCDDLRCLDSIKPQEVLHTVEEVIGGGA